MKAPDLSPLLADLPGLISIRELPDRETLENLFREEYAQLRLRDGIRDLGERIRYDCDNRIIRDGRRNRLVLLSLVLEDRHLLKELVNYEKELDEDHKDYQRYHLMIGKSNLGWVSFDKTAENIRKDMEAVFRELDPFSAKLYRQRLETCLTGLISLPPKEPSERPAAPAVAEAPQPSAPQPESPSSAVAQVATAIDLKHEPEPPAGKTDSTLLKWGFGIFFIALLAVGLFSIATILYISGPPHGNWIFLIVVIAIVGRRIAAGRAVK